MIVRLCYTSYFLFCVHCWFFGRLAPPAHALGDLPGVALDAGDEGVAVHPVLATLVGLFDDDGLPAGHAASGHDDDPSGFDELAHFLCCFLIKFS